MIAIVASLILIADFDKVMHAIASFYEAKAKDAAFLRSQR